MMYTRYKTHVTDRATISDMENIETGMLLNVYSKNKTPKSIFVKLFQQPYSRNSRRLDHFIELYVESTCLKTTVTLINVLKI